MKRSNAYRACACVERMRVASVIDNNAIPRAKNIPPGTIRDSRVESFFFFHPISMDRDKETPMRKITSSENCKRGIRAEYSLSRRKKKLAASKRSSVPSITFVRNP